jgi:hypothetical protein
MLARLVPAVAEAGYNTLLMDVFMRGFAMFPSAECRAAGLPAMHPELKRLDLLEQAASLAAEHELQFYAGIDVLEQGRGDLYPASPFQRRTFRKWRLDEGKGPSRPGHDKEILLCAASAYVQRFFARLTLEIADRYPVHGIVFRGLQFGPQGGARPGYCYCVNCRASAQGSGEESGNEESWDATRLRSIFDLIAQAKARTRKSRRTVLLLGTSIILPGAGPGVQAAFGEFDHDLLDLWLARTGTAENGAHAAELLPSVDTEPVLVYALETTNQRQDLEEPGHSMLLDFEHLNPGLPESPASVEKITGVESNPLGAAWQLLSQAIASECLPPATCELLRQCLSRWPRADEIAPISLESILQCLESCLPEEEGAAPETKDIRGETPDESGREILPALALVRLALMRCA